MIGKGYIHQTQEHVAVVREEEGFAILTELPEQRQIGNAQEGDLSFVVINESARGVKCIQTLPVVFQTPHWHALTAFIFKPKYNLSAEARAETFLKWHIGDNIVKSPVIYVLYLEKEWIAQAERIPNRDKYNIYDK